MLVLLSYSTMFKTLYSLILSCGVLSSTYANTYYLSNVTGSDQNSGLDTEHPWKSLAKIGGVALRPGDQVLLKSGSVWENECLVLSAHGDEKNPIKVTSYGKGALPVIAGNSVALSTVVIDNPSYLEISNLEITNIDNTHKKLLRGITFHALNSGKLAQVTVKNLYVHDITGPVANYHDEDTSHKSYGGIVFLIEGNAVRTWWDELLVEGCKVTDANAIGITFVSPWAKGHRMNDEATWAPSTHVVIRGNTIMRSARNGLIIRACVNPIIEHNLFKECAIQGSGNACFSFDCDGALFQYNESCFTKFNPGDVDSAGYDSDWNCRGSIFQFNYSHDNDYGFILVCCMGKGFNDGTIVRYNISQNDNGVLVRFSGTVTNTYVYNNTLYAKSDMTNPRTAGDLPKIFYFKSWNGWAKNTFIFNNLIYNTSEKSIYDNGGSTGTHFSHNLYWGYHPKSEPNEDVKFIADPKVGAVGAAEAGWNAPCKVFSIGSDSAASSGGLAPLKDDPRKDYLSHSPSDVSHGWFIGALLNQGN